VRRKCNVRFFNHEGSEWHWRM